MSVNPRVSLCTQTITCPNNQSETYTFNENKELTRLESAQQNYTYQRDALGRITQLHTEAPQGQKDIHYSYDALGQLIQAGSQSFSYDKAGNNLHNNSTYDTSMHTLTEDDTYTYEYDNGNLKRKIDKQTKEMYYYTWNDFNQLREVYKANKEDKYIYILRFSYDGLGRRIRKQYLDKIDETKSFYHRYLYHDQNIIAILDANNNAELLATIVHHPSQVDTPLSITNHETQRTYYYHRDHQGSIVALTNEEGQTIEHITYDGHYGSIINHSKEEITLNPYGYTGRETDSKDLYYYRARYYDPTIQRFLSRDPIEFEAGDFNFYRYVGGDPINFVDPSGLFWNFVIGAAVGGGYEAITNWNSPNFSWGRVAVAAGAGALGGFATGIKSAMALGAVSGAGNNAYQQLDGTNPCKEFDWSDTLENAAGGMLGARLGEAVGNIGKGMLRSSTQRDVRRIIPGAFPNGANYGGVGAVTGAALGEASGSTTSNELDRVTDEWGYDTTIDLGTITVTPNDSCTNPIV